VFPIAVSFSAGVRVEVVEPEPAVADEESEADELSLEAAAVVVVVVVVMNCRHCYRSLFVKLSHKLQGRRSLRRVQSGVETFYAPDILSCPAYRFRYSVVPAVCRSIMPP
jgi:hypothetical protein